MAEYSDPGYIVLGASRLGNRPGIEGKGIVAHLRFRALTAGRAVIKFHKSRVLDKDLAPIQPLQKKRAVIQVGAGEGRADPGDPGEEGPSGNRGEPPLRG